MEYMTGVSQNWVANALAALAIATLMFWKRKKWMMPNSEEVKKQEMTVAAILIAPLFVVGFIFFLSMMIDFINLPEPLSRRDLLHFSLILAAVLASAYSAMIVISTAIKGVLIIVKRRH